MSFRFPQVRIAELPAAIKRLARERALAFTIKLTIMRIINYLIRSRFKRKQLDHLRESKRIEGRTFYYKLSIDIDKCNRIQIPTVYNVLEMFSKKYGKLCASEVTELRFKLNQRMNKLNQSWD